ncbi:MULTISPECIES: tripartite tricarboxylate transporter substrate binding protein [Acidovorax]|uniref:Tripartite-type tricarboxylate transporter, receptor component TctC n=1 Tax=Acidovorax soli TaxID=592050 RepID=A0A1H4ECV2_9BURK|nr:MULTISPECIES: tripartite tricarboxylate transporter substrate binding protein [Acidovorax]SEA82112.1 Tripartite-type tricarboxylate transporter, receptor component TctC [Acidovorax soli]
MNALILQGRRAVLAAALAAAMPWAQAQSDKPVRLIVPLTTGSTVDTLARALGQPLARALGQPVVVDNLVGAGGVSGTTQLVRAPKDGNTLALVSSNHVINPAIYKTMPFDSLKDITPITVVGTVPLVLVATNTLPVKNLRELVAYAKTHPGQVDYGSAGNGSVLHLAAELLKSEGGIFLTHIPYRGTGPLTTDLIGGQIQLAFLSVTAAAPHVKAGKLRALGVSTTQRSTVLPDVPTLAESGLPNYSFDAWLALIGPAGLSKPLVQKLYQDVRTTLALKEVQDILAAQGIAPVDMSPEKTEPFFKTELAKHGALVQKAGAVKD